MASMNVMDARRYVKVGQIAAAAMGLVAAGLWAADVPGLGRNLPQKPVVNTDPAPAVQPKQAIVKLDRETAADLAQRLEDISKVIKPTAVAEKTPELPKDPEPPAPAWTYLGPIQEPSRLLALVSVEGHQKVIAEGRKYGDTRLVSVLPDGIVIEDATGRHTIALAERSETAPRVAWVKTMPVNTPVAGGNAPNGPGGAGAMSAEVAARLRERGINPEEATQRWRQQMRDRMNRGGGPGGPGGNGNGTGQGPGNGRAGTGTAFVAPATGDIQTRATLNGQVFTTNGDGNVTVTRQTDDMAAGEVQRTRRRPRGEDN